MASISPDVTTATLGADELARFREDGFLVCDDLFSPEEVELLREACDAREEDRKWKESSETIHSRGLTERHPRFLDLVRDARIVRRLIPLIGPNIQIQHSKLAAKPMAKGVGSYAWHQDFPHFPHTNTDLVAVMVMLDDATPENGCMNMVRGSHKLGSLNHINDKGVFVATCLEPVWESEPDKVVPITPRAGGISLHHCMTVHGSGPNLSGKPRRGIVIQYRASDAFQMAGDIFGDAGLIVAGVSTGYARCTDLNVRLPWNPARGNSGYGTSWNQCGEFAKQQNAARNKSVSIVQSIH